MLAAAAAEFGDGALELTSRGNLQLRGLAPEGEREFAGRLAAAGLLPSPSHERVRNVIASPLSGRDGAGRYDVRPLVTALDEGLCADPVLAGLPGRFLFTLDDGRGDVTGFGGDVGLLAVGDGALALLLDRVDTGVRVRPGEAAGAALLAARAFLDERAAQGSSAWRLAELAGGAARVAARLRAALSASGMPATSAPDRAAADRPPGGTALDRPDDPVADRPVGGIAAPAGRPPLGRIAQCDGRYALSAAAPLGRLTAPMLDLLDAAARAGGDEINITPWRSVVIPDLAAREASRWLGALAAGGLVTDPGSPWAGVSACAGRPGCARSLADVRADADAALDHRSGPPPVPGPPPRALPARASAVRAASAQALPAQALPARGAPAGDVLPVHWVGCGRRCGRPAERHVEVLATAQGYEVRLDGALRSRSAELTETAAAIAAARRDA